MFRLTSEEWEGIRSQTVTGSTTGIQDFTEAAGNWSQFVTSSTKHRPKAAHPYAFTEQGVAMLSGILNSDKAISMNIAIMRAFVEVRKVFLMQTDLREQLKLIREQPGEHDAQLNQIYDAMENLLDEKAAERKWEDRERIGFK
jgi:hypothetical protein